MLQLLSCHTVWAVLIEGGPQLPKVFDVSCFAFGTGNKRCWLHCEQIQLCLGISWVHHCHTGTNREKPPDFMWFERVGLVFFNFKIPLSPWKHFSPALISCGTKGSENGGWSRNQEQQVEFNSFAWRALASTVVESSLLLQKSLVLIIIRVPMICNCLIQLKVWQVAGTQKRIKTLC